MHDHAGHIKCEVKILLPYPQIIIRKPQTIKMRCRVHVISLAPLTLAYLDSLSSQPFTQHGTWRAILT